jgi:hypothetical protein
VIDDGVVLGSEFEQHGSTGYRVQRAGYRGQGTEGRVQRAEDSVQRSAFSVQDAGTAGELTRIDAGGRLLF